MTEPEFVDEDQQALYRFMSYLSERYYHAGWLVNLEYILWHTMKTGSQLPWLDPEEVLRLNELSAKAGGWVTHEEPTLDLIFVPWVRWYEILMLRNESPRSAS